MRLRDNLSSLDCLDLSTQSSTLLSPYLNTQLILDTDDESENIFPFRISPTNSTTLATRQHKSKALEKGSPPKRKHDALASVANIDYVALDHLPRTQPGEKEVPPIETASAPQTPAVSPH